MKKGIYTPIFHGLIAMMSLLFITNKANGQTTLAPKLNKVTGIYNGLIINWTGNVDVKDTVNFVIEVAPNTLFTLPQEFFYRDSASKTKSYVDTITVAMGLPKPSNIHQCRIKVVSPKRMDSLYSNVDFDTTMIIPTKPKVTLVSVNSRLDGFDYLFNFNAGSKTERAFVKPYYRYDTTKPWASAGSAKWYTGIVNGIQDSITGLYSHNMVYVKLLIKSSYGLFSDTMFNDSTNEEPLGAEIIPAGVKATSNSVIFSYYVVSHGIATKIVEVFNGKTKIVANAFIAGKMALFSDTAKNLKADSTYTFTITVSNSLGNGQWLFNQKTAKMPVKAQLNVNSVYAISGGVYFYWDWMTNTNNKFKNIIAKVYEDSMLTTKNIPMLLYNSLSQLAGSSVDSVKSSKFVPGKKYWVVLVGETDSGQFIFSNVHGALVKFGLNTKTIVAIPTGPVQCKLYNLSGKLISENYTVNPKVNLFTQELPIGQLVAVADGYLPFRVYNQGGVK